MEWSGDGNSKVVDSLDDIVAGSALNASILNYYKKFGRKRDLEQYFSLSTAQSEIRDQSSLFWRKMKTQSDSDSGEKKSESSNEVCRISIKCYPPETEPSSSQDDNKVKEQSQSPPIIVEEAMDSSRNLDDSMKSDDDQSHKSMDAALDTSTNKPFSPTSSITSQRKLEWDSLADVGYGNETDRKASGSSLSTLERLALKQQYSNNDSQSNIGVPTAHSTPQDEDLKSKVKGKTTKLYNRDIERVEVNIPHASTSNQTQAINVNLTKHISFNVDQGGGIKVDNIQKDISVKPSTVSVETEITPQLKYDKEIQTTLTKSQDKSSSSGDLTNNAPTYGKVLISLNSLKKRHRRKKLKNVQRIYRSRRRVVAEKENIPMQEKSGEQVSEAESFEYMPGHIYNQNQLKHISRPSNAAGNKSSLESSGVLTTDSSKTSKASFTRDLEKSVTLLKLTLKNHQDSHLKQNLIKAIVHKLIKSTYRGDESSTEFLSGLSFNTKILGLGDSNHTTSSTSDANATREKATKPKKSILRNDKFNPSAIASSSQSVPNLPSVSNSENPVTSNLVKQLLTSNTDSDISSKEKTSSDNAFAKTSSEELYQKYIDALKREQAYKRHLRDKEMLLKQKLVSSDSMLKLPANLDPKSQGKLKDIIKDLTRNNYDDGSGDASKLEGGSNGNLARVTSGRKLRSHSVFTLSSGNSDYHNRKESRYNDPRDRNQPGSSRDKQWYDPNANPHMNVTDSSVQVNLNSKPSSSRVNPLTSDYRESRSSQTNIDYRRGSNDRATSSSNKTPSRGKPNTKQNDKVLVHEATRSIQTEMSINPQISDPSLHDIRIVNDTGSLISEHYREKSKSTIPTTDQQDNADDYTSESGITDGTSGYYLRLPPPSTAPTDIEANPDNFAIPIQGTNMTLMVSLNSNPLQIPNLVPIDKGTGMDKPHANVKPRNEPTKPNVNTLFTRQNFMTEIYPAAESFHEFTPRIKKCNDFYCPKVRPPNTRQTSTDTSENEFKINKNVLCSDNSCHVKNICTPNFSEPIKFDMGTNTDTQNIPIKPSSTPRNREAALSCASMKKANLRASEPPTPKKVSTCTSTDLKKPITGSSSSEKSHADTCTSPRKALRLGSPRNPDPKIASSDYLVSSIHPGQSRLTPRITYNEECECPESSECKEGPCDCKKEVPENKSTCDGSPRKQYPKMFSTGCQSSGIPTEKPLYTIRRKHNEDCECPETSECKDGPCGCKKEIPEVKPACGSPRKPFPKKSSVGCQNTGIQKEKPSTGRHNKECECPETSECKEGPCDCKKEVPEIKSTCGGSPRKRDPKTSRSENNDIKSKRKPVSPRNTYNEECECPETSECKEGPCDCKKEVTETDSSTGGQSSSNQIEKPSCSSEVKNNEECECPETSECKEGPCDCKREKSKRVSRIDKSKGCSGGEPPAVLNKDCECPESSKCKDGPCGCGKNDPLRSKYNTYPKEIKITTKHLSIRPNTLPSDSSVPKSIEIKLPQLQFKEYLDRLKNNNAPESCSQGSGHQTCDTDNPDYGTSKDLIMEIIQDITKRYSKKDVAKSQRKKCFKEIMTILNYLLDTDEGPDAEQLKVLMSNTTQEDCGQKKSVCSCCRKKKASCTGSSSSKCAECGAEITTEKDVSESDGKSKGLTKTFCRQELAYSVNVEDGCTCGALSKKNKECTCKKKICVDKAVQLSTEKSKSCEVKKTDSSEQFTSDLPCTTSDSATCKVLNKIRKECERYQQKRCQSHHSCRKCDTSSSTSANCDCCKCRRVRHCYCKSSHKCRCHKHKIDKLKKKGVAYNLIIQTSESMISEGPSKDNCRALQNIVVKVPPSRRCTDMGFQELATKIEGRILGSPRTYSKAQRSRSLPNDSISSNEDKLNVCTVREYLERNRPDFVEHSSRRQNCVKMMSDFRAREHDTKRKLLSMQLLQMDNSSPLKTLSEADLRRLAKELGIDSRSRKVPPKFMRERDMKRHSEKIYKSLPEVVRKKEEAKKESSKKTNLLMATLFNKNLQRKTLSGSVNLSNHCNVVKI